MAVAKAAASYGVRYLAYELGGIIFALIPFLPGRSIRWQPVNISGLKNFTFYVIK